MGKASVYLLRRYHEESPDAAAPGSGRSRQNLFELDRTGIELEIDPVLGNKRIMIATLDDTAMVEDHYRIGIAHG